MFSLVLPNAAAFAAFCCLAYPCTVSLSAEEGALHKNMLLFMQQRAFTCEVSVGLVTCCCDDQKSR